MWTHFNYLVTVSIFYDAAAAVDDDDKVVAGEGDHE